MTVIFGGGAGWASDWAVRWRRPAPDVERPEPAPGHAWMVTPLRFHEGRWETHEDLTAWSTTSVIAYGSSDDRRLVDLTHNPARLWPSFLISSELASWVRGRVEHLWRERRVAELRERANTLEHTGVDPGPSYDDEWPMVPLDETHLEGGAEEQVRQFLRANPDPDVVNLLMPA